MDINFSGMNGIDVTKVVKSRYPDVPVIILTVQEDERYQVSAYEAGADGYVIKRHMYSDLIPLITSFLKNTVE